MLTNIHFSLLRGHTASLFSHPNSQLVMATWLRLAKEIEENGVHYLDAWHLKPLIYPSSSLCTHISWLEVEGPAANLKARKEHGATRKREPGFLNDYVERSFLHQSHWTAMWARNSFAMPSIEILHLLVIAVRILFTNTHIEATYWGRNIWFWVVSLATWYQMDTSKGRLARVAYRHLPRGHKKQIRSFDATSEDKFLWITFSGLCFSLPWHNCQLLLMMMERNEPGR